MADRTKMTAEQNTHFCHTIGEDAVSKLTILKSMAGYYIGRTYWDDEFEFEGPYSRESEYYPTAEDAEAALDQRSFFRDAVENCIIPDIA